MQGCCHIMSRTSSYLQVAVCSQIPSMPLVRITGPRHAQEQGVVSREGRRLLGEQRRTSCSAAAASEFCSVDAGVVAAPDAPTEREETEEEVLEAVRGGGLCASGATGVVKLVLGIPASSSALCISSRCAALAVAVAFS